MQAAASDIGAPLPVHSKAYLTRRFFNWFPLGLLYAFLYMARYNLNVAKNSLGVLMTEEDFGFIFFVGTLVYGFAFIVNGPLTDRIGGKRAALIGAFGAAAANLAMGLYLKSVLAAGSADNEVLRLVFSALYAVNMYFQSFGAVAIVKVNSRWFHVRERGGFSGIFGVMISSGIFFAYTINAWILDFADKLSGGTGNTTAHTQWVFLVPSALLLGLGAIEVFLLKDRPGQAGHLDFNTGDATSGDSDDTPTTHILRRILTNPIILTLAFIELCTGVIRQGVMQWYPFYAKNVLSLPSQHHMRNGDWSDWTTILPFFAIAAICFVIAFKFLKGRRKGYLVASAGLIALVPFLQGGWGGLLFVAGVIGGNVAGYVSDLFFQSRRAPAAGGFYALLIVCTILMVFTMGRTTTEIAEIHPDALKKGEFSELRAGDKILGVAGKGDFKEWRDVTRAFASVPAACVAPAQWDSKRSICSTNPEAIDPSLVPSTGFIAFELERAGQRLTVQVKDPSPKMRAGDERRLRAMPVASHSPYLLGVVIFLMSLSVIGTHGLLSGTATMDFGGTKGAATAVGLIDGFVYLGTAIQSISLGFLTAKSWNYWPWFMLPFAIIGFLLSLRIWKAAPQPKSIAPSAPAADAGAAADASSGQAA
ncbi:MAG: MFS transporter [Myxococcales bacterium]|jgi:OPA family glycerol-3-phosphate transporter-like MFS transporter|nr:MFS transporter [Myxococcales bacterium]